MSQLPLPLFVPASAHLRPMANFTSDKQEQRSVDLSSGPAAPWSQIHLELIAQVLMGPEAFSAVLNGVEDCHRIFVDAERGKGGRCPLAVAARSVCQKWKVLIDPVCSPVERIDYPVQNAIHLALRTGDVDVVRWIWKHMDSSHRERRWPAVSSTVLSNVTDDRDLPFLWWLEQIQNGLPGDPDITFGCLCKLPQGKIQMDRLNAAQSAHWFARSLLQRSPAAETGFDPSGTDSVNWLIQQNKIEGYVVEVPGKFYVSTALRNYDLQALRELMQLGVPCRSRGLTMSDISMGTYEFYEEIVKLQCDFRNRLLWHSTSSAVGWYWVCREISKHPSQSGLTYMILQTHCPNDLGLTFTSWMDHIRDPMQLARRVFPTLSNPYISHERGVGQWFIVLQVCIAQLQKRPVDEFVSFVDGLIDGLRSVDLPDDHRKTNSFFDDVRLLLIPKIVERRHQGLLRRALDGLMPRVNRYAQQEGASIALSDGLELDDSLFHHKEIVDTLLGAVQHLVSISLEYGIVLGHHTRHWLILMTKFHAYEYLRRFVSIYAAKVQTTDSMFHMSDDIWTILFIAESADGDIYFIKNIFGPLITRKKLLAEHYNRPFYRELDRAFASV
jgi:hypothetical protein